MIKTRTVEVVKIQIRLTDLAKQKGLIIPSYARAGDAGIDLRSVSNLTIKPKQRSLVKTGIHMAIPPGLVGLIRDRSGLAHSYGIHVMAGVIDANYRGEIGVVLLNTGDQNYSIQINDRIAQLIILPVAVVEIEEVETLNNTNRAEGGWGSTGK